MKRVALFMGIVAAASIAASAWGQVPAVPNYLLLELQGQNVKWGAPLYGTPASVSYAYATTRIDFDGAINCESIEPLSTLAEGANGAAKFKEQIEQAFDSWERRTRISFTRTDDERGADIVIGAQRTPLGIAFSNISRDEARSGPLTTIRGAVICLNPGLSWETSFDGDASTPNIRYVVQHEIGHAIGLDHPGHDGALMGYAYDEIYPDLLQGDIDGAAFLYGRRAETIFSEAPRLR